MEYLNHACGGVKKQMDLIRFSEMPYSRPDVGEIKKGLAGLAEAFLKAEDYAAAKEIFLKEQELEKHLLTQETVASIRHSVDTRDPFYDAEEDFWNHASPEIEEYRNRWTAALLESPFRTDFAREYGEIVFLNAEIARRAFSPEIIPELQREGELVTEYMKLIASAQIPFKDGIYTLSQLSPWKNDPDDAARLDAWKAEGAWYKERQEKLDAIYDELVRLRDAMGRKLGHGNFVKLGYDRMERNCYTKEDVERFRAAVRKYLVPAAERIFREQAERTGLPYPLSFSDAQLEFRSGNPKPCGTAEDILNAGARFYSALSAETEEFWEIMRKYELMDVLSTEGKEGGGYCTSLPDYGVPFIFANFNGTQGDVEVVTHEAGHAFAAYVNGDRIPVSTVWPGMEGCEVHSMSMEFFAWPYAEFFFGNDADKYRVSHLMAALKFIPYGTMVDHFQHIVYEKPQMTPPERHAVWRELLGVYMPWLRLDGDIPFYADGEGWQRQQHIYNSPFYYIDYCLAQTVSLEFWTLLQEDPAKAWEKYMAYTGQGGSAVFTELLSAAGLDSPFEEATLARVCDAALRYLGAHPVK